jgi:hypothetical protein
VAYPYRVFLDETQRARLRSRVGFGTAPARMWPVPGSSSASHSAWIWP